MKKSYFFPFFMVGVSLRGLQFIDTIGSICFRLHVSISHSCLVVGALFVCIGLTRVVGHSLNAYTTSNT